jgi:hypothetical protein
MRAVRCRKLRKWWIYQVTKHKMSPGHASWRWMKRFWQKHKLKVPRVPRNEQ